MTAKKLTAEQRAFLSALPTGFTVTAAAKAAGVGRRTVYDWRDASPAFAAAMDDAAEEAGDELESEARRRAVDGIRRPLFTSRGEPIIDPATGEQAFEHKYSDKLLERLLAGAKPDKYRTRSTVDVNARATLADLTPAELRERARRRGLTLPDASDLE